MTDYKILIIGCGTVGKNLYKELEALNPEVYDKYTRTDSRRVSYDKEMHMVYPHYDLAFICVDTPLTEDDSLDTIEVVNAIKENDADIYVIKSTIPVGTTELMQIHSGKRLVFSPEYYGGTPHCNNFKFDFTILGGNKEDCIKVQQILQHCYDARHTFHITDSKTAELTKFMENSWIATKVSFCNQFYEIAKIYDISYEELRELFILDPRVNPSHTFVYNDHPYWDSHCLNKDIPCIAKNTNASLLRQIIYFNDMQKAKYDENENLN